MTKSVSLTMAPTSAHSPIYDSSLKRVLRRPATPLPVDVRNEMESRFKHDFSRVRIHADDDAASAAHGFRARAFTVGPHIHFAEGRFAAHSDDGRRLLTHELAHVVQQSRGGQPPSPGSARALELDAEHAATMASRDRGPIRVSGRSGVGIACQPESVGTHAESAPNAFHGIAIYPVVQDLLPHSAWSPPNQRLTTPDGSYVLHGSATPEWDGSKVLFYVAYSKRRGRSEIIVGPNDLARFLDGCREPHITGLNFWEIAAGNYFGLTGSSSEHQRLSAQAIYFAMQGDWGGYWRAWKDAQVAAFKDPGWWAYLLGGMAGGATAASRATAEADAAAGGGAAASPAAAGADAAAGGGAAASPAAAEADAATATPKAPPLPKQAPKATGKAAGRMESAPPGNKAASAKALAERQAARAASPPLPREQQEMARSLLEEHPNLSEKVAVDAAKGGARAAGKGGPGADVPLLNGGGREVSVHQSSSPFTADSIGSHLQQEAMQRGTTQVYLQINSGTREAFLKMLPEIRNAYLELRGVLVKIYGADGSVWWTGTFGGPK